MSKSGSSDLATMVASEMTKHFDGIKKTHLDPLEGLLKSLAQPASAVGMTPQQFLAEATKSGQNAFVGTVGGQASPFKLGQGKGVGMGPMLRAIAKQVLPDRVPFISDEEMHKTFADSKGSEATHIKAALAENSGTTGGYTVPPQFAQQLLTLSIEEQVVAPRASKQPMTSLTLQVPSLDYITPGGSTNTAGNTAFTGGVIPKWTTEAATRTETEPTFRQTELKAWELSLYTVASNNMLADNAVGLDSLLTQLFSKAIAWYTEYAYIQGTGVGQPLGMKNAPAAINVTRQIANRFTFADYQVMVSKLLMQSWDSAIWLMHPSVRPQMGQMVDPAGNVVFIGRDKGAREKTAGTLDGLPVFYTEKLPVLGSTADVCLFDCSLYLLGVRMDIEIAVSPHVNFLNNQMVWRVVWRGDGQPWLSNAITLADGAYTVSPFILLK